MDHYPSEKQIKFSGAEVSIDELDRTDMKILINYRIIEKQQRQLSIENYLEDKIMTKF
jgi:hypothetical protein